MLESDVSYSICNVVGNCGSINDGLSIWFLLIFEIGNNPNIRAALETSFCEVLAGFSRET